ncbi:hypothetical protein [Novosphingobium kaempferiae]|uniref:hypothetical protein n=1 Tax=Novosphingobium kaempferiae TaxID=2896849 RepID=UPI001E3DC30A|nr:hypothetical protein [Novosphingobium kaempferiae]
MFADGKPGETLLHPDDEASEDTSRYRAWADAPVEAPSDHAAMLDLQELADPEADPGHDPEGLHLPPPGLHTTGTTLRRRLVTPESIAELQASEKPSLIQRILRRK